MLTTIAIGVTVSATFNDGDTLTAANLNVLKDAIEEVPSYKVTSVTSNTILDDEYGVVVIPSSGVSGDVTVTLPLASDSFGERYIIKNLNTVWDVKIATAGSETVDGYTPVTFEIIMAISGYVEIVSDGSKWFVIGGIDATTYDISN